MVIEIQRAGIIANRPFEVLRYFDLNAQQVEPQEVPEYTNRPVGLTKHLLLSMLREHQQTFKNRPVNLTDMAKALGVSRARASYLHAALSEAYDLPEPALQVARIKFTEAEKELLDKEVAYLNRHLDLQQIADAIGITSTIVKDSLDRAAGGAYNRMVQEREVVHARVDAQVKKLKERGIPEVKIVQILGLGRGLVRSSVKRLQAQGELPIQVPQKASKEEARVLAERVRRAYFSSAPRPSYDKLARDIGILPTRIDTYISKARKAAGLVQPKRIDGLASKLDI